MWGKEGNERENRKNIHKSGQNNKNKTACCNRRKSFAVSFFIIEACKQMRCRKPTSGPHFRNGKSVAAKTAALCKTTPF
jgi:hypothetical protein